MTDYTFGDIRSLLTTPSAHNWRVLSEALRKWPDAQELHDVIVPYCQNALVSWPNHLRQFDWSSLSKLTLQKLAVDPIAALSTCLAIHSGLLNTRAVVDKSNLSCWSNITAINIEHNGEAIPSDLWETLLGSRCFDSIDTLRIYNTRMDQTGIDELLCSHLPGQLTSLHLDRCRLDRNVTHFEHLCHARMPKLVTLGMCDGNLRPPHLIFMAEHANWPSLRGLYLGAKPEDPMFADRHRFFNRSNEAALSALAQSPIGATLEKLALPYHQINEESIEPLLHPNVFPNLSALDLAQNYIGKRIAEFYESDLWSRLTWLDLSRNHIGVTQTSKLFQQPNQLHTLAYNFNKIGVRGLKSLINTTAYQDLNTLQVMDTGLTDEQITQMLNAPGLSSLAHLNVALNTSMPTISDIMNTPRHHQLKSIDVRNTVLHDVLVEGVGEDLSSMPQMTYSQIQIKKQRLRQLKFNAVEAPRLDHYFEGRGSLLAQYNQSTWPFWLK